MLLTTVKKCENPLTINSVYAGLSFGFFLKLQEERKKEEKVRDPDQMCTGNQRCRHQSRPTPPSAGHPAKERGGDNSGARGWCGGSPLGDEVYEVWREAVRGQLWRWLIHHLLELLERRAPRLVGEFQNG